MIYKHDGQEKGRVLAVDPGGDQGFLFVAQGAADLSLLFEFADGGKGIRVDILGALQFIKKGFEADQVVIKGLSGVWSGARRSAGAADEVIEEKAGGAFGKVFDRGGGVWMHLLAAPG